MLGFAMDDGTLNTLQAVTLRMMRQHLNHEAPIMKNALHRFTIVTLIVMIPVAAWADLYKYRKPNGEVIISTTPRRGLKLLEVISSGGSAKPQVRSKTSGLGRIPKPRSEKAAKNIAKAQAAQEAHLKTSKARRALSKLSKLSRSQRETAFDDIIREASRSYKVPFSFIKGVIRVESNFNPQAVSVAGAQGLMQLMPRTAIGLNVTDPFDPRQNIFGGTKMLRQLTDKYKGDINLIMAAYNAGPGNVKRYNGIPWAKTRSYVASVYHWYKVYAAMEKRK